MKIVTHIVLLFLISIVLTQTFEIGAQADQVIMVDIMHFIPEKSEYILDPEEHDDAMRKALKMAGNVWDIYTDAKALGGFALGSPGDNNFDSHFPLVFKLPVAIKAGEKSSWKMWARLSRTADPNSFWWKAGQDGEKWTPGGFNDATHGWNNPGATTPAKAPWFWFDGVGTPDFEEGDNYLMVDARESGIPPNVNLIDVIMIRNDGEKPTDEDAEKLLAEQYGDAKSPLDGLLRELLGEEEDQAVTPGEKLTSTWGHLKSQ